MTVNPVRYTLDRRPAPGTKVWYQPWDLTVFNMLRHRSFPIEGIVLRDNFAAKGLVTVMYTDTQRARATMIAELVDLNP